MAERFDYIAFISYAKEDERRARWLQRKLEHYHLPTRVREKRPDLPKFVRPIFRDATDFGGGLLTRAIKDGLESSGHLIVICSPAAARSVWVDKEVQAFIDLGGKDRIIPFIVEGVPFAEDPDQEAFPPTIQALAGNDELLGISTGEAGQEVAAVKVVSCLFGLRFDHLWQRHLREKRKRCVLASAFAGLFILLSALSLSLFRSGTADRRMLLTDRALKSLDEGDAFQARRFLQEALPRHAERARNLPPETEWALAQTLSATDGLIKEEEHIDAELPLEDGRLLILTESPGSNTAYLDEWDLEQGCRLRRVPFSWEGAPILYAFAFSGNGETLADDGGRVFDARDFSFQRELDIYPWFILGRPAVSPEGDLFAAAQAGDLVLVSLLTGEVLFRWEDIPGLELWTPTIRFSPDGKWLTCFPVRGPVQIIDLADMTRQELPLPGIETEASFLAYSYEGDLVLLSAGDELLVLDLQNGAVRLRIPDAGEVRAAEFSVFGDLIVTAGPGRALRSWDIRTGELLHEETLPAEAVRIHFCPDFRYFLAVLEDNRVFVRSQVMKGHPYPSTLADDRPELYRYEDGVNSFFCPGRPLTASYVEDEFVITVSDRLTGETLATTDTLDTVSDIKFSPDGKRFLTFGIDEQIRLFRTRTGRLISETPLYEGYSQILFSPSGRRICAHDRRGYIFLMNGKLRVLHTTRHEEGSRSITFSPDGKLVASAGNDRRIQIWQPANGKERYLEGHAAAVNDLAFSPDGRLLASVSDDCTLRIWAVKSGRQLASYPADRPEEVWFTPDGKRICYASPSDDKIRQWIVPDSPSLIRSVLKEHPIR